MIEYPPIFSITMYDRVAAYDAHSRISNPSHQPRCDCPKYGRITYIGHAVSFWFNHIVYIIINKFKEIIQNRYTADQLAAALPQFSLQNIRAIKDLSKLDQIRQQLESNLKSDATTALRVVIPVYLEKCIGTHDCRILPHVRRFDDSTIAKIARLTVDEDLLKLNRIAEVEYQNELMRRYRLPHLSPAVKGLVESAMIDGTKQILAWFDEQDCERLVLGLTPEQRLKLFNSVMYNNGEIKALKLLKNSLLSHLGDLLTDFKREFLAQMHRDSLSITLDAVELRRLFKLFQIAELIPLLKKDDLRIFKALDEELVKHLAVYLSLEEFHALFFKIACLKDIDAPKDAFITQLELWCGFDCVVRDRFFRAFNPKFAEIQLNETQFKRCCQLFTPQQLFSLLPMFKENSNLIRLLAHFEERSKECDTEFDQVQENCKNPALFLESHLSSDHYLYQELFTGVSEREQALARKWQAKVAKTAVQKAKNYFFKHGGIVNTRKSKFDRFCIENSSANELLQHKIQLGASNTMYLPRDQVKPYLDAQDDQFLVSCANINYEEYFSQKKQEWPFFMVTVFSVIEERVLAKKMQNKALLDDVLKSAKSHLRTLSGKFPEVAAAIERCQQSASRI